MTDTPLARLNRMIALSPHGANAARLLQNLAVFQTSFGRSAVIAMTPDDMSEAESITAFATLRNWCLVQQITRRRYQIDDSLKQHFPPSQELFAQSFDYFFGFDSARDVAWVYFYWRDFAWALLWGMGHRPAEMLALGPKLRPHVRQIAQQWPIFLDAIRKMAQRVKSADGPDFAPALRGNAPLLDDTLTSEEWYEQSLELYFQIDNPTDQAIFFSLRGLTARQNQDFALARHYYKQSLAIYGTLRTRFKQIEMSRTLFYLSLEQEDLETAQIDLEHHLELIPILAQAQSIYRLGQLAHTLKNVSVAREAFARALFISDSRMSELSSEILSDWSLMEHELGSPAHSCALYGLVVIAYHRAVATKMSHDYSPWQADWIERHMIMLAERRAKLNTLAAKIGCDEA